MTDSESLEARLTALEATVEQQAARIDDLEADLEAERQAREAAETRVDDLKATVEHQDALLGALRKRMKSSRGMIGELQSRELKKGGHLRWDHAKPTLDDGLLDLHEDTVERISKDDGEYIRLPAESDPLDRDGSVTLAHGDLLPIQQLAQLDEETLQSVTDARPDRWPHEFGRLVRRSLVTFGTQAATVSGNTWTPANWRRGSGFKRAT